MEKLESEGKITLSIGNHGLIFMQIVKTGNAMVSSFKKSYESYLDALKHYYRVTNRFTNGGGVGEWKIGDKFRVLKGIYGDYNSPRYANKEFEVINIRDGKYIDARTPNGITETFDIKNIEKIKKYENGGGVSSDQRRKGYVHGYKFDNPNDRETFTNYLEREDIDYYTRNGVVATKMAISNKELRKIGISQEFSEFNNGGGVGSLNYNDILAVLKEKVEEGVDNVSNYYESASDFKGEEIEHEYRDGFIPYTNGGYEAVWFERLGALYSSGYNLPTKPLDTEKDRQIDYNLEYARESFGSDYPEIVEELGEENINYNSLYDAGYQDEAEELSNAEMDMMFEDTIMMRILANYYNPSNSRAKDGKHTIRLFGDVNLESPYHRVGNLDDSYEYEFTFDSIDELKREMDKGIKMVNAWFNGDMYNESNAEMKIRKMTRGGGVEGNKRDKYNKLIGRRDNEFYFLDDIFHYEDGFKGATGSVVVPVNKTYYDYATSYDGILERYMDAMGEDEWLDTLGYQREDFEDEDEMISAIEDGIWQTYLNGGLEPFEEVSYDLEEQMRNLPEFSDSDEFPLFEIIGGGRVFDKDRTFDEIYDQELYNKIREVEEFKRGGGVYNRSWHQDHSRHNKRENYEVPMSSRKKAHGGTIEERMRMRRGM